MKILEVPAVLGTPRDWSTLRNKVNNMDHRIPLPFYACTELHDETLKHVPTAAKEFYKWLMRNAKPGTAQEFTKEEYDNYRRKWEGKKPLSRKWFNACIRKLIKARVLKVIYRCQGYWFRIIAYHPWQLDEWLLGDPKKEQKNPQREQKNPQNGSNTDSTVPFYRDSREKQSRGEVEKVAEKTVAAAPKIREGEKCSHNQVKEELRELLPKPKVKGQKQDLNASTKNFQKADRREKSSAAEFTKVNNKQWRSHLEQLDDLGVRENKTIRDAVRTSSTERVEEAIALYRQRKRETGYIGNPNGYFMQMLKENWAAKNAKQILDDSLDVEDKEALFRHWYDLAKELGYCSGVEERDGDRWVLISGTWEKFTDAWERGYNLKYLRETKKRYEKR